MKYEFLIGKAVRGKSEAGSKESRTAGRVGRNWYERPEETKTSRRSDKTFLCKVIIKVNVTKSKRYGIVG